MSASSSVTWRTTMHGPFPHCSRRSKSRAQSVFHLTIALTATSHSLRPRAAAAFEEFFLGAARELYPRYGFATMSAEEFGQELRAPSNGATQRGPLTADPQ